MILKANNINLHYNEFGKGHPIILLHGNGEDNTIFDKLIDKLSAHYKVYAIDSRNHGQSEKTDDYSYDTMAEDINAFINTLSLENPYILGFSDGAIIALLLSLKYPKAVSKMAWLGINLQPSDFIPEIYKELEEAFASNNDPLLQLMLTEPNITLDSLSAIDCPTLVVFAEHDLFRRELYSEIVTVMPQATLLEMKEHEHDSYIVGSDVLYDDLVKFLE